MKLRKMALLGFITLGSLSIAKAQTADEIITKHINAIGGKEKLSQINSLYQENTIDVMGNQATSTTIIVNGKGFRNEVDLGGQKLINCITDTGGWSINPFQGQTTAEPLPAEQVKAGKDQLQIGGPLFNYAAKGNKVELLGREDLGGVSTYKIKLVTPANVESTFFIDPTSFYILKTIAKANVGGQDMETTILFSDYKKTDFGFVVPYSTELNLPQGLNIKSTTTKVEINKPIDEKVFKAG